MHIDKRKTMEGNLQRISRLNYWNGNTLERELRPLKALKDNYRKLLVTMDDIRLKSLDGIEHVQAWELENYLLSK